MQEFTQFLKEIKPVNEINAAKQLLVKYSSHFNQEKICDAVNFSIQAHEGQKRKSGEAYVIHPLLVATVTSFFSDNEDMVISALLHDVVEDTEHTIEEVEERFGKEVAHLVEGLTKIDQIRSDALISSNSNEKLAKSALSFRKMLMSSIQDIRVLVIKLCDRLHNILTLDALPSDKQKRIAEETVVVYAPIAHRLGISTLKNHLEDFSFRYLLPEEYRKIDKHIKLNKESFHLKLNEFVQKVDTLLRQEGLQDFQVQGRIKHYYSIFLKMQRKGISIEEVLDLLAIRIVTKENIDCYQICGQIHLNFKPLISRFKDYIAIPKENGYQTLHTTVFNDNSIIEVQIRTEDMDKNAEYGIAAHWKYKLNAATPCTNWLSNMHFNNEPAEDFYELAKNDLFSEDIVVYSPKFEVFTLPREATVLDYAYAVHTDIGNKAIQAFVNKEKSSLLQMLKSGDIIKIMTGNKEIARCSWLDSLKTSKAKYAQKTLCNYQKQELNKEIAVNILMTHFNLPRNKIRALIKSHQWCSSIHKIPLDLNFYQDVISKFSEMIEQKFKFYKFFRNFKLKTYTFNNIRIYSNKAVNDVDFSYCCHPKLGDTIIGILDKKKVYIHHLFCNNAKKMIKSSQQMVFVEWLKEEIDKYSLVVNLPNKKGNLADFVTFLAKFDINILSIELSIKHEDNNYCSLEVEIHNQVIDKLNVQLKQNYKVIEFTSLKDAYNNKL